MSWRRRVRTVAVAASVLLSVLFAAGVVTAVTSPTASASAWEVCSGYGACNSAGHSSHDYQAYSSNSYWRMSAGDECTNYVAFVESAVYKVPEPSYVLGDAVDWPGNAAAHGVQVNGIPSAGAVAEWDGDASGMGPEGHVAVVEEVGPDDSYIVVSQQHIPSDVDGYDWERISAGNESWEPWPSHFIHFRISENEHMAVGANSNGPTHVFTRGATRGSTRRGRRLPEPGPAGTASVQARRAASRSPWPTMLTVGCRSSSWPPTRGSRPGG